MPCPNKTLKGNPSRSIACTLHNQLLTLGRRLLIQPTCRLCRSRLCSDIDADPICPPCNNRPLLNSVGLRGLAPLPWHSLSYYDGAFRSLLLRLKHRPDHRRLSALIGCLRAALPLPNPAVLASISSWKRRQANPIPGLIATALGKIHTDLMQRTRASAGKNHLNLQQRLSNLSDDFRASAHAPAMEI